MAPPSGSTLEPDAAAGRRGRLSRLKDKVSLRQRSKTPNPTVSIDPVPPRTQNPSGGGFVDPIPAPTPDPTAGRSVSPVQPNGGQETNDSPEDRVWQPVTEVWDEAYRDVKKADPGLVASYEEYLSGSLGSAVVFAGVGAAPAMNKSQLK